VHLANEMLEKALELVDRAIGGGQELAGVEAAGIETPNVVELGDQLAAKSLDPPANRDRVAGPEAKAEPIGIAEDPRGDRPAAIAQPERQIGGAVAGGQALLRDAREPSFEALSRAQRRDLGMDLSERGLHVAHRRDRSGRTSDRRHGCLLAAAAKARRAGAGCVPLVSTRGRARLGR
jgi:hypothetical protein